MPPPSPLPGIVVKDRDDPNVERGGTASTLRDAPAGSTVSNGSATWTDSKAANPDNYLKWKPPLDQCGNWEVFAYIPWVNNGRPDTTSAQYRIRHRSGRTAAAVEDVRTVDIAALNTGWGRRRTDRWYSLGTYLWSANAHEVGEYVFLGDTTGESTRRTIGFDDMRWVYHGPDDAACAVDHTPPDGHVVSPEQGATIGAAPVNFTALAWDDPDGMGVERVDFYVFYDGTLHHVGTDSEAPFAIEWSPPAGLQAQQLGFAIHVVDRAGNEAVHPGGDHYVTYQPEDVPPPGE